MANLVQLANELEYVPKMQLAEMAQDPNNRFPQYLVLSEIQRRTLNERAYAAAQPQPTTTVAEEVVQNFVQPKGLQAGIPSESAPTDAFSSESMGMPASAPMQQPMQPPMAMASGGLTGYANQGRTALPGVLPSLTPYAASEAEEYEEDANSLKESFKNSFLMDALVNYMMQQPAVSSSLDATMALHNIKKDVEESDYSGPTGAQIGGGLLALASVIPHTRRIKAAGKWGKNLYEKTIKPFMKKRYGAQPASYQYTSGVNPIVGSQVAGYTPKMSALRKTLLGTGEGRFISSALPITAGGYLMSGYNPFSSETGENKEQTELTKEQKDYIKMLQEIELANAKASQEKSKKGLDGAFSPTDLIQLGGTVMGARNISELGQGIAGVAGIASERKTRAEEVEINKRLREAQISQLETETALLPDKQLADEIEGVTAAIKQAEEGGADEERIAELRQYLQYLLQQQAMARGYNPQAMSGTNQSLIASYT